MDRILAIPMFNSQQKAYLLGIDLHRGSEGGLLEGSRV